MINYENWVTGTRNSHGNDPIEYNGKEIDNCKRCDMNVKYDDTDVCSQCIDELEEMKEISLCCGDTLHVDTKRCTSCREWSESSFYEYCKENNFDKKTYKYKPNNK